MASFHFYDRFFILLLLGYGIEPSQCYVVAHHELPSISILLTKKPMRLDVFSHPWHWL